MTITEVNIGNHVNIEINPENPCQAVASLDFNEVAVLSYAEVCDLLVKVRTARGQIEWAMTDYAEVRNLSSQKCHITLKDDQTKTFCNRSVGEFWVKYPLLGKPGPEPYCKRCFRAYEDDIQHPDMEEVLECQAVQYLEDRQNHSMIQF